MDEKSNELPDNLDEYSGGEIKEIPDTKVPKFLKLLYLILPIWGIIWFFLYWNGSNGYLDRGHWRELQEAAKTTFQEVAK
jgi:hypothetical protein